jgi:hypothetical protein
MRHRALLIFLLALSSPAIAQTSDRGAGWVTRSCPDDERNDTLHDAPMPPPGVIRAVLSTNQAKDSIAQDGVEKSGKLLHARRIDLAPGEIDYIVLGGGLLSGADNYWFWLVRAAAGRAKVDAWFGADCVFAMRRTHEGHRDIRVEWASAAFSRTQIFHFHDGRYQLWREHSRENR